MDIKVYDWEGNQRDLAYLTGKYGNFIIQPAADGEGLVYKISALREKVEAPATLVVRVVDDTGSSLEGIRVAWYWPDAPEDPNAGPMGGVPPSMRPDRCVSGWTNTSGDAGFGMGRGAYYFPNQGQIGPHATWIHGPATRSDVIQGLGMLGGTNHDHFDVEFSRLEEEPGPPGPGPGQCPKEEILAKVSKIEASMASVRSALAEIETSLETIKELLEDV